MSLNINNNSKYIYSPGEQIYDIYRKKKGIIKYLRDDEYEKSRRLSNPAHYCYFIEYDDKSFDTYVSVNDFIPCQENNLEFDQTKSAIYYKNENDYKNFKEGQKFFCSFNKKKGTIKYLREGEREQFIRLSDPTHYYYHVDFDDGTFETYIHGMFLKPI